MSWSRALTGFCFAYAVVGYLAAWLVDRRRNRNRRLNRFRKGVLPPPSVACRRDGARAIGRVELGNATPARCAVTPDAYANSTGKSRRSSGAEALTPTSNGDENGSAENPDPYRRAHSTVDG